jgi:hypothetical protein
MRFQVMRRWRSPSIAFAKAPRGRISSGIEDQNAAASPSAIATIARQSWCAARSAPSQPPRGTPDVDRDAQANCPTIAMNAGEFGRPKQPDHHVL